MDDQRIVSHFSSVTTKEQEKTAETAKDILPKFGGEMFLPHLPPAAKPAVSNRMRHGQL